MSGIMQVMFFSSGVSNWVETFVDTTNSSNFTVIRNVNIGTDNYCYGSTDWKNITKFNATGGIQWQYSLGSGSPQPYAMGSDSSNNLYLASNSSGIDIIKIASSTPSVTTTWTYTIPGGYASVFDFTSDSTYLYVAGSFYDSSNGVYGFAVMKISISTGTLNWVNYASYNSSGSAYGVKLDSSGNVYACGTLAGNDNLGGRLVKYNSAGVLQWVQSIAYSFASSAYQTNYKSICIDSSDNIYTMGTANTASNMSSSIFVARYNTNGTIQWQSLIQNNATYGYQFTPLSICTDNSYVYVLGQYYNGDTVAGAVIVKYDLSGNVQWQRRLSWYPASYANITVTSERLIFNGYYYNSTPKVGYSINLDVSGGGTGSFTVGGRPLDYVASSFTIGASTLATQAATNPYIYSRAITLSTGTNPTLSTLSNTITKNIL